MENYDYIKEDQRIQALRDACPECSALLLCSDASVFWATGYAGGEAELIITPYDAALFTDFRYIERAQLESSVRVTESLPAQRIAFAGDMLGAAGFGWSASEGCANSGGCGGCAGCGGSGKLLGIEASSMTVERHQELIAPLGVTTLAVDDKIKALRAVKTPHEIEMMKRAAAITQEAFFEMLAFIKPGVSEADIYAELSYFFMKRGAEHAFTPIIASGKNSSMPHAGVTNRRFESGDLITMDFGAKLDGYCSDFTRTVAISGLEPRLSIVYNICAHAQKDALENLKAGVDGRAAHERAAGIINNAGYELCHGLGHGVGTEIHESPRLSAASTDILVPGHVVTVEPGIYIQGLGGVRIEDMVLITPEGVQNFYTAEKDLIIL